MKNKSKNELKDTLAPESSVSPTSGESPSSSPDLSAVEVLSSDDEGMTKISQTMPNTKKSWLPWKRPHGRDQQIHHLREGYVELLGLVRSISHHLDSQKDENSKVTTLVETLPPALKSFETLAESQQEVTTILGHLNSHMEKTSVKDELLLANLEGFNSALKDVSSSNEKSLGTLHQVSERIEHSDEQMKSIFVKANESNQAAGALMVRLEKRVFLSNMALVVLLTLLLLSAMIWVTRMPAWVAQPDLSAPVAQLAPPVSPAAPVAPVVAAAPAAVAAPVVAAAPVAPIRAQAPQAVERAPQGVLNSGLGARDLLREGEAPSVEGLVKADDLSASEVSPIFEMEGNVEPVDSKEPSEETSDKLIESLNLFEY